MNNILTKNTTNDTKRLANRINSFLKNYDFYDYNDNTSEYENEEKIIEEIVDDIENKTQRVIDYISMFVEDLEEENDNLSKECYSEPKNIINELERYLNK